MRIDVGGVYLGTYAGVTKRLKVIRLRKASSDGRVVVDYRSDLWTLLPWWFQVYNEGESIQEFLNRLDSEKWANIECVDTVPVHFVPMDQVRRK